MRDELHSRIAEPDIRLPGIILSGELFFARAVTRNGGMRFRQSVAEWVEESLEAYSAGICGVGGARKGAVALCVLRVALSTGQVVSRRGDELYGARYSVVWISYPKYKNKHFFDNYESAFTREPFRYRGLTIAGMLLESRIGIIDGIKKLRIFFSLTAQEK